MPLTVDGGVGGPDLGCGIGESAARWLLVGILLLGTGLIFHDLGRDSLWLDEITQAQISSLPVAEIVADVMKGRGQPPFYWVALHFFMPLGGSEFAVRMLSAMFGVLNIVLVCKLGRALFGRREGMVAAFLMAVSPLHLSHAQDARMYTAMVCFSTLSWYWLYRAMQENGHRQWLAYAASSILNLWNHAYAAFVFGAEVVFAGVWLLWETARKPLQTASQRVRGREHLRAFLLSNAAIAGAWAPMLVTLGRLSTRVGLGSGERLQNLPQSAASLAAVMAEFAGGAGLLLTLFTVLLAIGLAACLASCRELVLLFLLSLGTPVLGLYVLRAERGFFSVRYVIFLLPLFLVFVSRGILVVSEALGHPFYRRLAGDGGSCRSARQNCFLRRS